MVHCSALPYTGVPVYKTVPSLCLRRAPQVSTADTIKSVRGTFTTRK